MEVFKQAMTHNASANVLTEDHPLRGILRLAGPTFVAAALQNAQNLIDLFWVGRLGSEAVAALAMSGTVLMLLFPMVIGLAAGSVAFVSRHIGGGDSEAASDGAGQCLSASLLLGLAAGAAGWLATPQLLGLLGASAPVAAMGTAYLRVSFLGCFTIFVLFLGNSVIRAAGNAMVPMLVMLLANMLNLVLDPIMIFGLGFVPPLGVQGAALATVISQGTAMALILGLLFRGVEDIQLDLGRLRLKWQLTWRILRIGLPSTGQMLARSLMALVLMRIVAGHGTVAVAAYGIGLRFQMLVLMPAFALGNAAATMVGQNLGAERPERAQHAAWIATRIDMGIMLIVALLLCWLAPALIRLFDSNPAVVATGTRFIRTVSPFYVFVALAIVLGRALQGAGETLPPMIITVIALWLFQVPLAVLLSGPFGTGGIWWAIAIAILVHGVLVVLWFQTGRWKRRRI